MDTDIPEVTCPLEIVDTLEIEEEIDVDILEDIKYDVELDVEY